MATLLDKFNHQEQEEIEALQERYEVVKKLMDILYEFETDPMKKWYTQIQGTLVNMGNDLEIIAMADDGNFEDAPPLKIIRGTKNDTTFDQIMSILNNLQKIATGYFYARSIFVHGINPDDEKKKSPKATKEADGNTKRARFKMPPQ